MRIISLIASSTEIVCGLGYGDRLVGRSHECDFPPEVVEKLPVCSSPKLKTSGTSLEIDREVKSLVEKSLSIYKVDADKLKALKPDVIVTQDHCQVCAVSLKDVENAVCEWLSAAPHGGDSKPKIVTLHPNSLEDIWKGMRRVAEALGDPESGERLITSCKARMNQISGKAKKLRQSPSIVFIEWMNPLMTAGNWMPELTEMLGAKIFFGETGKHSPHLDWNVVLEKDPDVMLVMPCGWDMERSLQDIHVLTDKPGWKDLKAVRSGRVYLGDGSQYFNRPGPRLVESLEILAEILYPDAFPPKHQGAGWKKLDF